MQNSNEKLNLILKHLFKRDEHRELVKAVVTKGVSVYEAEKLYGVSINTGTRHTKKYETHIMYLKNLGINI
jgi:transposase